MMTFTLILAIATFFSSSFCADIPEAQQKFYDVNTQLCGIGIKQWYEVDPKNTQMSTAFPLILGLIQFAQNAKEDQQNEILSLLNQPSLEDAITTAKAVLQNLNADNDVYRSKLEYRAFPDKNSKLTDTFIDGLAELYNGTVEYVDFSDGDSVATAIKDFLQVHSDDKDITGDGFKAQSGALALASSLNLKFHWGEEEDSYRPYSLVDLDFTEFDGTTSTKSGFYCEGDGKYGKFDEYGVEVFQFALKGGLPVLFYKPYDESSMETALEKMTDPDTLATILTQLEDKYLKITVPVPREFSDVRDYVPEVQMANFVPQIFEPDYDGFSTVLENESGYILKLFNHLSVEFDAPPEKYLDSKTIDPDTYLDGPFFYTLLDQYNTPVLIGMVTS